MQSKILFCRFYDKSQRIKRKRRLLRNSCIIQQMNPSLNEDKQTELGMIDVNGLQTPCEVNPELTKPLVLFLNSRKEVLSSAPTSPNSSDGETSGPLSSVKYRYPKDSRNA
ncbi:unnamed protein product [Heterobilharzia americana]|nr:unnamed protein product [Heterobilharzia americana]